MRICKAKPKEHGTINKDREREKSVINEITGGNALDDLAVVTREKALRVGRAIEQHHEGGRAVDKLSRLDVLHHAGPLAIVAVPAQTENEVS